MYRANLKTPLKNPGPRLQTDKKNGMTLMCSGGDDKGIFFQWDGEARFAFNPSGQPFHINIRRVLNIPVVLGPFYDEVVVGDAHNGESVRFEFCGDSPEEIDAVKTRVLKSVRGELNEELNATQEELQKANGKVD